MQNYIQYSHIVPPCQPQKMNGLDVVLAWAYLLVYKWRVSYQFLIDHWTNKYTVKNVEFCVLC